MILNERETRHTQVMTAVGQMMTAARTAPKGKGMDVLEIMAVEGKDIETLSAKTRELGEKNGLNFFLRDAENILSAEVVVLIGTRRAIHNLNCAYCGFPACADKPLAVPCAVDSVDVGIAIGSACATAADFRLDTRVMFSVGYAAQALNLPEGCRTVFAVPVAASSKNPFFDRVLAK
ncbi:MAG: DUF2148 domain-containing protein [Dysgonamonadaceae bacterium]|jgi:uncharacterized ferredoxin-like protein|nr:DUF2148 domain-containing protein [Dysgonamonadaceae bacterium]